MKKGILFIILYGTLSGSVHGQLYVELGYASRFFHNYFRGHTPPEHLMEKNLANNNYGVNIGLRYQIDPRHSVSLRYESFINRIAYIASDAPNSQGGRARGAGMRDLHLTYRRHFRFSDYYKWENFMLDNVFIEAGPSFIHIPYLQRSGPINNINHPHTHTFGMGIGAGVTVATPKDYQLSLMSRLAIGFRPLMELIVNYDPEVETNARLASSGTYLMTSIVLSFPIYRLFPSNDHKNDYIPCTE